MPSAAAPATGAASLPPEGADPGATLDAWRARGAHRFDPVRFRFIEAFVERAARHGGRARRLMDEQAARLLAAYGDDLERARGVDGDPGGPGPAAAPCGRGPLAELVAHLGGQGGTEAEAATAGPGATAAGHPAELKAVRDFRRTWSRLAADRRLAQSLAKVPQQAGPLHSHYLVHRSLVAMREVSPEYLERFLSYVDALLWLEEANEGRGPRAAR